MHYRNIFGEKAKGVNLSVCACTHTIKMDGPQIEISLSFSLALLTHIVNWMSVLILYVPTLRSLLNYRVSFIMWSRKSNVHNKHNVKLVLYRKVLYCVCTQYAIHRNHALYWVTITFTVLATAADNDNNIVANTNIYIYRRFFFYLSRTPTTGKCEKPKHNKQRSLNVLNMDK